MTDIQGLVPLQPEVAILDDEYESLSDLVCASAHPTGGISLLWQELKRARRLPSGRAPDDVVRVDSRVYFSDIDRREERMVRLVYPHQAASPNLEPVTSTIGAALIGLRPGDVFQWRGADGGTRAIKINAVEPPTRPKPRTPHRSDP